MMRWIESVRRDVFALWVLFCFLQDARLCATGRRTFFGYDMGTLSYCGIPFEDIAERCCRNGAVLAAEIRAYRKRQEAGHVVGR